ncbi:hypothetical protein NLI96_g7456 [Meripilus lineatus]|uniref:Glutaredoxin domain-containing protein n=1 Tax=Meripilus lineatus TaxID=2056292 RepID=A0AAD5UZ47_9APHY|nr:hypothetical protein NLI96_g7456 [Physisporinus lineatus]
MAKDSLDSPPLSPPLTVFHTFTLANSRKTRHFWQRTTFLALFALVVISGYVLFIAQPQLSPIAFGEGDHRSPSAADRLSRLSSTAGRLAALRHKRPPTTNESYADRPQVTLDTEQELAAVTGFIASLPQNVIPPSVDPTQPIDPQLILDFDTRTASAPQEVEAFVVDTWARNPVVLYSRTHSPVARELKQMLVDMNLFPSPTIVELDQRTDEDVLTPLLFRLTSTKELPILLVGGHTVGSVPEIRYLNTKGDLKTMITRAGAVIDGGKKKKGRKH